MINTKEKFTPEQCNTYLMQAIKEDGQHLRPDTIREMQQELSDLLSGLDNGTNYHELGKYDPDECSLYPSDFVAANPIHHRVLAQYIMELLGTTENPDEFHRDTKIKLLDMAEHLGPDWAQALFHASKLITKLA